MADDELLEFLPAWGLARGAQKPVAAARLPKDVTRTWAVGGATGTGVRVCVLDSGIDPAHPLVGQTERSMAVERDETGKLRIVEDDAGDVAGHGTACAGIIRAIAPLVSLTSVRVLGGDVNGSFSVLRAGIEWALDEGFDLLNLSLSVRRREFALDLAELVDRATHGGTILVCSAHNTPVHGYPWRFASVISVACHDEDDSELIYYNPRPPVDFYARGVNVPIAWPGGGSIRATGNSFATPHITGVLALIRSKHPDLTPFEQKTVLYRLAANVRAPRTLGNHGSRS